MNLAWNTFLKYDAPDCRPEGVKNFKNFITDPSLHKMFVLGFFQLFVAVKGNSIIGLIGLKKNNHISLLFVDERYQREGVGKALIDYAREYILAEVGGISAVTVNASLFATEFYHKLGFTDLSRPVDSDGVTITRMQLVL